MADVRVIIIGAGFGGLEAAKALAKRDDVHVIIIDRRNYHLFQPLLYQVATAGLEPADIAVPIRAQFKRAPNVEVHLGTVDAIEPRDSVVVAGGMRIAYDYLIVATGSQHSYFGHADWERDAPGLKSLEQAIEIRRRILLAFERAENALDDHRRAAWLTFVVVGAGPTGVELAGAIADVRRTVLARDFRRFDPRHARVLLLEAGPRILAQFDPGLAERSVGDLAALGVEVMTSTKVETVDDDGVVANGKRIAAKTVLWAAGVQASHVGAMLGAPLDRAGRVHVTDELTIPDHRNVFVVGDLARFELADGKTLPGLAAVAMQQGRAAAHNILATIDGTPRAPFHYHDKGMLATLGKHRAIVETKHVKLNGYFAWLAWLFVHVFYLAGFRNRVSVFLQWIWSYLFSKRSARLITTGNWRIES